MNETALAKTSVKSLVESPAYSNRIKSLLGERAPQFCSSLVQISQTYGLSKCDPNSIIAAAMIAASLDLPINPNLGFAWIIPYKDKAQFQLGYKGMVQLANRSGQYKRLNVAEVYEGELLKHDRVKGDVLLDADKKKSDKVIGIVAYFELTNGHEHAEYWPIDVVEKHAARFSQAFRAKKQDSPWFSDFNSMAKKTVLKSLLSHWGPLSVQMQTGVVNDGAVRTTVDTEPTYPEAEQIGGEAPKELNEPTPVEVVNPPTKATPQTELAKLVTEAGYTFAQFVKFGENSGNLSDPTSYPDFLSLPPELCTRLLKSKKGLLVNLDQVKNKEGQ